MTIRTLFLMSVLCAAACGQVKTLVTNPPLPPEQLKAEAQKIADSLKQKPEWLFSAFDCPAEVTPDRGSKPQYTIEGCADNPGRCLDKCRADDPTACYALALLIEREVEIGNETSQALFLRSCKRGILSGCTNHAANILESRPDDFATQKCAADTFEKTCSQDDPWGCVMFGLSLTRGDGRPRSDSEALKVLQKACDVSTDKMGPACKRGQQLRDAILRQQKPEKEVEN